MTEPDPVTDFDLYGLAGVRVIGASSADLAVVRRQLGPLPAILDRAPDITIRFVDRIDLPADMRLLGANEAGWTDDAFYLLKSRKQGCIVRFPIDRIGGPCEIVCQRGLPAVPYLIATLNTTVLANGGLPVHAGAFELDGQGVLVMGWSKGGKTELLMAAAAAGARYIADEWVYLTADGAMSGIPEPIRLWDWHIAQLPMVRASLPRRERLKLATLPLARRLDGRMPGVVRRTLPGRLLHRAVPVVDGQRRVDIAPERLFGPLGTLRGHVDHVLLVMSATGSKMRVEPIDPDEVARRMVFSLIHERLDLATVYLQARYAFPDLTNPWLEQTEALQRERLRTFLAARPAHLIVHPYPVDLGAFLDVARSVL